MDDGLIEDRMAASLRFGAHNGTPSERAVFAGQAREAVAELRRLRGENASLEGLLRERCCGDAACYNESNGVPCAAHRSAKSNEAISVLRELRIRLHAAGRRPEECYEMSLIDSVLSAA